MIPKDFYRCTDPDGKMPSLCTNKPDRPTWIHYINDRPVSVSPNLKPDKVWDYSINEYVTWPKETANGK